MTTTATASQKALYYPYIHIRSERWLKATLLCIPVVTRIVPNDYTPEDSPDIVRYTEIVGPNGPLLQPVSASSSGALSAQQRLLTRLKQHEAEIAKRYRRQVAPPVDEYWTHAAKFNMELLAYLAERDLA